MNVLLLFLIFASISGELPTELPPISGQAPIEPSNFDVQDLEENQESCPICIQEWSDLEEVTTICNHRFHLECLNNWISRKNECPLCRKYDPTPLPMIKKLKKACRRTLIVTVCLANTATGVYAGFRGGLHLFESEFSDDHEYGEIDGPEVLIPLATLLGGAIVGGAITGVPSFLCARRYF